MKRVLNVFLKIIFLFIIVLFGLLVLATISDYKPEPRILLYESETYDLLPDWTEYDLMTWNIGYCALDASMDFFYDGGEMVRPPYQNVLENINAVKEILTSNDSVEFFLIQEVDMNSKRSYHLNLSDTIGSVLENYYSFIGINYDVDFVPVPPKKPMGKVYSGLQNLSRFKPEMTERFSFPGNYSWPMSVFMLDRCFLVNRFALQNGKQLLVINTHNSAYDDGQLRNNQMNFMKEFLLSEYNKGNYVVVGGDWNQSPFGFSRSFQGNYKFDENNFLEIPDNYPEYGWTWAYDGALPTNRRVIQTYKEGETPTALLDFYLLSPNIQAVQVKTLDLNFQHSDHHPVLLKLHLKQ